MSKYRDDSQPEHQARWDKGLDCLQSGDGDGAVFLYKALANDGCAAALAQIGRISEHGVAGVEQNFEEATKWYKYSVETTDDVLAHLALARIYLQDKSIDPSRSLAIYHLKLLADNEVMGGFFGLGLAHDFGIGVEEDKEMAGQWYGKAEAVGHVGARLCRIKNLFLQEPAKYLFPFIAASIRYHWMYFFTKSAHRLLMADHLGDRIDFPS